MRPSRERAARRHGTIGPAELRYLFGEGVNVVALAPEGEAPRPLGLRGGWLQARTASPSFLTPTCPIARCRVRHRAPRHRRLVRSCRAGHMHCRGRREQRGTSACRSERTYVSIMLLATELDLPFVQQQVPPAPRPEQASARRSVRHARRRRAHNAVWRGRRRFWPTI
jgi:hypothetical protein